ncbi:E3 ubiquitin-protein ligase E3D-like isoform X2 [Homarus americanus]|uniref:E3 ubiquitin-protein ligase E3D n=2 Tax=Homarus americanus TaxID=6706 RepID=A0A8J5KF55_HOMAM|nr:E3 ubiquitin-protein ligase E3D-like isoform X2 [Homarus americanus]XP_042219641.1 E3 ubiquitin-protein ligase E3D-like isoform X2 [Homarus americanus]KAG7170293.1 E3 ubiquitin-protein ligase E3D-like [Homarus americanus]
MPQVLFEVLPNILACNMYITLPPGAGYYQKMLVSKSDCTIELQDGETFVIKIPKGSYLVPNSATGIIQKENIITARAAISEMTSLISTLSGDILSTNITSSMDTELSSSMSDSLVSAHCKQCLKHLCTNIKFRRVLPLPSVDWDQASEGWFCHLHAEDGHKLKPASLQPEHDECFYTELFFLIHPRMMDFINAEHNGCTISCSGCKMILGEKTSQSIKLWAQNLSWLQDDGKIIYDRSISEILLSLFHNIDRDNFGVNCRLVLQPLTMAKKYLYMVTMNTNQKLLVSDVPQCVSSETILKKSNKEKEGSQVNGAPTKKLRVASEKEICLKKVYAIKLLYLVKEDEDEQTGEWVDDVNVHIIPCSNSFFQEVKCILENSSHCLPDNIRAIENMSLGYIIK